MEQRRQPHGAASGWEVFSDDQGRNGRCNILVHQMTRVGRVAGLSAIGYPKGSLCRSFRCFLTNQHSCQGLSALCIGERGLFRSKVSICFKMTTQPKVTLTHNRNPGLVSSF